MHDHPATEIAPERVAEATPTRERFAWASDNPLVRAVARMPLPLGAKLVASFFVVTALLALVVALGLVALGQSNARGAELRALQQQTSYYKLLESDANNVIRSLGHRLGPSDPNRTYLTRRSDRLLLDDSFRFAYNQFLFDLSGQRTAPGVVPSRFPLQRWDPTLARKLQTELNVFSTDLRQIQRLDTFGGQRSAVAALSRASSVAPAIYNQLHELAGNTTARAQALVAQDSRSYGTARNLLSGIGAGSLSVALALGLLLSWSIVVSVRRTQERLAQIADGDFSGHVEVPNRDEIGALAADVNRMNDELERVYRELETASRHKSDFLATMSHELRTPLNAIIGFSEVLREQMFGELNERQLAYVDDVLEAGRHLLSLINDVLDLAKIEAGRMELELSDVAVPEVLRSAVSIHAERASRGGIELSLATEPEEITIAADERRVRQVVFNLLSNAVKFTPPQGRVDVSVRLEDGEIEIAVADTGPGIPPEDIETIFEEFEQTSDGKKAEGTGLGLPLSRKLVELHHGRLWVESKVGRGSTFRFTLPIEQEVS